MDRDAEGLVDGILARLEDTRGFKAWWNKLDEDTQDDVLTDLKAVVKRWMKG